MLTQENVASNRRILIVDDNPEIHGDFKKILAAEPETATALQEHEAVLFGPSTLPPNRHSPDAWQIVPTPSTRST